VLEKAYLGGGNGAQHGGDPLQLPDQRRGAFLRRIGADVPVLSNEFDFNIMYSSAAN
jgi:hypothetical protein